MPDRLYDHRFWAAYAAHALAYVAHALTFRMADFVGLFGGTMTDVGLLVGAGLASAIATRLVLGHLSDRFGVRAVWLGTTAIYLTGNAIFVVAASLSPLLYLGRILFAIGYSGMIVVCHVSIQSRAPRGRRTEAITMLGTAMSLGAVLGSFLGDYFVGTGEASLQSFYAVFGCIAVIGTVYAILAAIAAGPGTRERHITVRPPLGRIADWPWRAVVVAVVLGVHFATISFLAIHHLEARGVFSLGPFFLAYCTASVILRVAIRRRVNRSSANMLVLLGCGAMVAGQGSMLFVNAAWHVVIPAVFCATARALLEPTLIRQGADAFGDRERGSGTALILTAIDFGIMIGAPILGAAMDHVSIEAPFVACAAAAVFAAGIQILPSPWPVAPRMPSVPDPQHLETGA